MTAAGITGQARVVGALAARSLVIQTRKAQLLIPTFLLPMVLLAVIANGASPGQSLRGFPDTGSFVGFIIAGTLVQGTLLCGMTAGIALAADIEGGFFDRLLTAPVRRVSLVLGRLAGTAVLALAQAALFLAVAFLFGARYQGGVTGVVLTMLLATITAVGTGGLAAAIALRTGSLSLLQSLFPLVFVLLFTAPAFFPRDLLHPTLQTISEYNPLAYVVEGMRAALHDDPSLGSTWHGLLAALGLAIGATGLSVAAIYRRMATL